MTFVVDDPIIKLEQLVFSYGDTRAVDGISLDVGSGEILGYIGPNGAGKTTTRSSVVVHRFWFGSFWSPRFRPSGGFFVACPKSRKVRCEGRQHVL